MIHLFSNMVEIDLINSSFNRCAFKWDWNPFRNFKRTSRIFKKKIYLTNKKFLKACSWKLKLVRKILERLKLEIFRVEKISSWKISDLEILSFFPIAIKISQHQWDFSNFNSVFQLIFEFSNYSIPMLFHFLPKISKFKTQLLKIRGIKRLDKIIIQGLTLESITWLITWLITWWTSE